MTTGIARFFSAFRADGWQNILTGLGRADRDKATAAVPVPNRFTGPQLDQLYRADDIAKRIVARPPRDMFRAGYKIKPADSGDKIEKYLRQLNANYHLRRAKMLSRLKGGAVVVMGIDDGLPPEKPVNEKAIKSIKYLTVLDRDQISFHSIQNDPAKDGFGFPETYQLMTGSTGTNGQVIHKSRVLRFDGVELPEREFIANNYWGDSVLTDIFGPLQGFNTAFDSAIHVSADFMQTVYELENLHDLIASGDDELVQKRLLLLDSTRSIVRAVVIQKGENFRRESTTLTGYPELLKVISNRLVAASEMPHTIILGEGSEGNTSGRSEQADYYDFISQEQTGDIQPKLEKLISYICVAGDGPKVPFDSVSIAWNPLFQETASEKANTQKAQAEADQIYIQSGVLDPDEVAQARFGNEDSEIPLNNETRSAEPPSISDVQPAKLDAWEYAIQMVVLMKSEYADAQKAAAWIAAHNFNNANIEETENSFRFVQRPEVDFAASTITQIKMQPGIDAIIGVLKNGNNS